MIKAIKLSKTFNKQVALKDFTFEFPNNGIVAVLGSSGCGKSTLLNILSGLLKPNKGEVIIDGINIHKLNDKEKSKYRLNNMGFIFQDFKLFESGKVKDNILLPLESNAALKEIVKEGITTNLLNLVNLDGKKDITINKLSGGEKQRVAIARSLINSPKIIFADEPTGSLDEMNSNEIMNILKMISNQSLVILVSHDEKLVNEYADKIIKMKDGVIESINERVHISTKENIPIKKVKKIFKTPTIPDYFLIRHTLSKIKEKKWRNLFSNAVMSLSLIGVGASITLTSSISSSIKSSYSEAFGENRIIVSKKENDNKANLVYAADMEDAYLIEENYQDYVVSTGVTYLNDLDTFFPTYNAFQIEKDINTTIIENLSISSISEYKWSSDIESTLYPSSTVAKNYDEITLGLTLDMVHNICFALKIERNVTALEKYLYRTPLEISLVVENSDWTYYKSVSFKLVSFVLENTPCVYHAKKDFNKYVIEDVLQLSVSSNLSESQKYPWEVKKIPYLKMRKSTYDFLTSIYKNNQYKKYMFEIANKTYYRILFKNKRSDEIDRVLVFLDYRNTIDFETIQTIEECSDNISKPIYSTYGGYFIYSSSLLSGFYRPTYFTYSEEKRDETIDSLTALASKYTGKEDLPDDVLLGHYSNSLSNGVTFEPLPLELKDPKSSKHVYISSSMAKTIYGDSDIIGETLYLAFNDSDEKLSDGRSQKHFLTTEFIIEGIISSSSNIIYQRSEWSIFMFQCYLGVSAFSLGIDNISYQIDKKGNMDSTISSLSKLFKNYDFVDPLNDFNLGVDEVCSYIEMALIIISFLAVIVSILLLSSCVYLHVIENKKDIGLARCLGIPKWESTKFLFAYALISAFISFAFSTIELLVFSYITSLSISNIFSTSMNFSFNPLALFSMLGLAIAIAMISSLIFAQKVIKIDPIESLKE